MSAGSIDMNLFLSVVMAVFVALLVLMLYRVFRGPTIYDRLNGLSLIGVEVVVLLVFIGFVNGRAEMFIDIAMTFAILGFVGSVVIARFLFDETKRKKQ